MCYRKVENVRMARLWFCIFILHIKSVDSPIGCAVVIFCVNPSPSLEAVRSGVGPEALPVLMSQNLICTRQAKPECVNCFLLELCEVR